VTALEQVLRESMRVAAPVPVFMRRVREGPVKVGSVTLDSGVRVIIGVFPLHHDAGHWPDPTAFRPDRWTPDVIAENPFGSAFLFPFGRGARSCQGEYFALFQLRSLLTALLGNPARSFELAAPEDFTFYFGCRMPQRIRGWVS
jgi:cytochrome P450